MGSLQLRLFLTYLAIIGVTLGLAALSLFLLLGGYRDSISYGNLEDVSLLINQQVNLEIQSAVGRGEAPPAGNELLFYLRQFLNRPESSGGLTQVALIGRDGRVTQAASESITPGSAVQDVSLAAVVSDRQPRRCRLEVVEGPGLLCVVTSLSPEALAAFEGTDAVAIVVAKPATGLGEVLGELMPRLAFSGLVALAAALVLGALMSRSIAAPLRDIARAARSVARGNYRQRVPVTGPSEVRELASDFNRMTGDVQRTQQSMRDFLTNISHELKTPLTSIRGFSEAMLDGTLDDAEGYRRAARIVNVESARVLRLVEELLDLSRIESGQLRMRQETVDLHELFHHVGEVFAIRSEESGVRLELRAERAARVRGDFDRLEQVLNNLLDNAFRHTPAGGLVRVTSRRLPTGFVQVTVSDTGRGIPPDDVARLFERFYRGGNGGTGKGYGLGLAITREIVRAHGGDVRVQSEPGKGAAFIFTLPSADPAAPAADAPPRRGRRSRIPGLPTRPAPPASGTAPTPRSTADR
jgi:signal transduction histidine kinase